MRSAIKKESCLARRWAGLTWCWFCSFGDLIFSNFSARVGVAMMSDELQAAREVDQAGLVGGDGGRAARRYFLVVRIIFEKRTESWRALSIAARRRPPDETPKRAYNYGRCLSMDC